MDMSRITRTSSVSPKVAALSIVAFWIAYYISLSARSVIMDYPGYGKMFDNRAAVTIAGMGLTWLLYLFMRRFDRRRLGVRVAAAFLAALPVAAAYAGVNYYWFRVHDPDPKMTQASPASDPSDRKRHGPAAMIAEAAIQWYFFVACWAALYLALSYAAQVRSSERDAARYRGAAREAELRALRYQVNPHFLFNTLNSISSLVMAGRAQQAETMILSLSGFFRTSLAAAPTEDVRLTDEIALQRLYLDIEAVRFPDRLRVEVDVEPGLEDACVPGMILQPLVENAIKHGVSPARHPVTIRVAATAPAPGRLSLRVEDDGGAENGQPGGTCVGLRNVADRLRVRFGNEASIKAGPRDGGGFSVELCMPQVRNGC